MIKSITDEGTTTISLTVEGINALLDENRRIQLTFVKKDGTTSTKMFTKSEAPPYEKKTDRVRAPRDPNYMSLWSIADEGYRTFDVTKVTDVVVVPVESE